MAARISVVISQFETRQGQRTDFEEHLVTRLMFENGLDATLIGDFKQIDLDSTDHLCLEGLKGDYVLFSWEPPEYAAQHLQRLNLEPFSLVSLQTGKPALGASPIVGKRIYWLQLQSDVRIESILQSLKSLMASRATPVYSLGIGRVGTANPSKDSLATTKPHIVATPVASPHLIPEATSAPSGGLDDDDDFPELNSLVDDLERFDL